MTKIPSESSLDSTRPSVRRPRQKRSILRFEAVLDAAERLLEDLEPDEISIYTLAEYAQISPPSIYQFFPDSNQVFIALSERIHQQFVNGFDEAPSENFATWQDLIAVRFREGRNFYNSHAAARRLLLGSGLSAAIRARDLQIDRQLAERTLNELQRYFIFPEFPELVERFTELLVINDALWTLSVHRHGMITDSYEEQARRAREAYLRTFLPEYLPARRSGSEAA